MRLQLKNNHCCAVTQMGFKVSTSASGLWQIYNKWRVRVKCRDCKLMVSCDGSNRAIMNIKICGIWKGPRYPDSAIHGVVQFCHLPGACAALDAKIAKHGRLIAPTSIMRLHRGRGLAPMGAIRSAPLPDATPVIATVIVWSFCPLAEIFFGQSFIRIPLLYARMENRLLKT